jgi:outer membrane receptor protein involved in Fe transport
LLGRLLLSCFVLLVSAWSLARGVEPETPARDDEVSATLPPVTVSGERPVSAASDQTLRELDLLMFPRRTASDLMRLVPGLHITQHTGGAKAHQIFLRGFDAEHGQDVAVSLDGIPLNEASHVHGLGYLDLHFLIPEAIERVWILKGPYDPRFGDYATAGVIDFVPALRRPGTVALSATGGSFGTVEGLIEASPEWGRMSTFAVAEADRSEGFTEPGARQAGRGLLHHGWRWGRRHELRLLYAGYGVRSEAADILPQAQIDAGAVSRFGALDPSNRVDVQRHLLGLTWEAKGGRRAGRLQAYANWKSTDISSNYTFYAFDPVRGDQVRQQDERVYGGLQGHLSWRARALGASWRTTLGCSGRVDAVSQSQGRSQARQVYDRMNRYDFVEGAWGLYVDERAEILPWLRIVAGLRADLHTLVGDGTQDRLGAFDIHTNTTPLLYDDPVSYQRLQWALSPRLSLIATPREGWRVFLNLARAYTPTHARQLAWRDDPSMPAVHAGELATAVDLLGRALTLSLAGWVAEKGAESVFDSEVGAPVPRGRSLRLGLDLELRWRPREWLWLATDVYAVRARFLDTDEPVPNGPTWLMTNSLGLRHPCGARAALRGRFVGPREHDLGYASGASYVADAQIGWAWDRVELGLEVENMLGVDWVDSVFAYTSRPLQGGELVEGLHVTPGTPMAARLRVKVVL